MYYPQSRFGGLLEYRQIIFEKKGMAFPDDWPGTRAGDAEEAMKSMELKEKWNRRPHGKRESWAKVIPGGEIGDPFKCDWSLLRKDNVDVDPIERIKEQAKTAMGEVDSVRLGKHFLLPPEYAKLLLLKRSPMISTVDLTRALIPIQLHFLHKGNVSFRARIYSLPKDLKQRQKWINLFDKDLAKPPKKEYPQSPAEADLLGFVTTGNVCLSEGRGRAVGALSWIKAEEEEERWLTEKAYKRWCIVRDAGLDIGRLAKWDVISH